MRAGVWAPRGRRAAAYLCFALAVTLGGAARGRPQPALQRQLQLGQYRLVHRAVLPMLTASPDDPDLMAMLGAALAKAGCAGDAEAAFRLAEGSPWAEAEALPLRADALRTLGAVAEAGALRRAAPRRSQPGRWCRPRSLQPSRSPPCSLCRRRRLSGP
jgi:hypothetical protein